jgi:hypothetical protein
MDAKSEGQNSTPRTGEGVEGQTMSKITIATPYTEYTLTTSMSYQAWKSSLIFDPAFDKLLRRHYGQIARAGRAMSYSIGILLLLDPENEPYFSEWPLTEKEQ